MHPCLTHITDAHQHHQQTDPRSTARAHCLSKCSTKHHAYEPPLRLTYHSAMHSGPRSCSTLCCQIWLTWFSSSVAMFIGRWGRGVEMPSFSRSSAASFSLDDSLRNSVTAWCSNQAWPHFLCDPLPISGREAWERPSVTCTSGPGGVESFFPHCACHAVWVSGDAMPEACKACKTYEHSASHAEAQWDSRRIAPHPCAPGISPKPHKQNPAKTTVQQLLLHKAQTPDSLCTQGLHLSQASLYHSMCLCTGCCTGQSRRLSLCQLLFQLCNTAHHCFQVVAVGPCQQHLILGLPVICLSLYGSVSSTNTDVAKSLVGLKAEHSSRYATTKLVSTTIDLLDGIAQAAPLQL